MVDFHENVLVPYERFVERQERRRRIATALTHPDEPSVDDDVPPPVDAASALRVRLTHRDS